MGEQPELYRGNFRATAGNSNGGLDLDSLEGSPKIVNGDFVCYHNKLVTLEHGPKDVTGDYYCNDNILTSLKYSPEVIHGDFVASYNKITSLEGMPREIFKDVVLSSNELETLKDCKLKEVFNSLYLNTNKLQSLEGVPRKIGQSLYAVGNKITSLQGIHKYIDSIGFSLMLKRNPIKSHVLGVVRIANLRKIEIDNKDVEKIINKYLAGDRDIFACQEELIDAGFEDFAQL